MNNELDAYHIAEKQRLARLSELLPLSDDELRDIAFDIVIQMDRDDLLQFVNRP